jgi:hypothetical protein
LHARQPPRVTGSISGATRSSHRSHNTTAPSSGPRQRGCEQLAPRRMRRGATQPDLACATAPADGGTLPAAAGAWRERTCLPWPAGAVLPTQAAGLRAYDCAPAAHGAWTLQRAYACAPPPACALLSSIATLLAVVDNQAGLGCEHVPDALAACRRVHSATVADRAALATLDAGGACGGAARHRLLTRCWRVRVVSTERVRGLSGGLRCT